MFPAMEFTPAPGPIPDLEPVLKTGRRAPLDSVARARPGILVLTLYILKTRAFRHSLSSMLPEQRGGGSNATTNPMDLFGWPAEDTIPNQSFCGNLLDVLQS